MHLKKSFQTIKNELMKNEEILKHLQKSHPHLAHFSETQILHYFNVNSIDELDRHSEQIKASQELHVDLGIQNNEVCACRDSKGEMKSLYDSEASAQAEADTLSRHHMLKLSVYRCPYGSGWHLTKR